MQMTKYKSLKPMNLNISLTNREIGRLDELKEYYGANNRSLIVRELVNQEYEKTKKKKTK